MLFSLFCCMCLGTMDDVLDSVCPFHCSGDHHWPDSGMVRNVTNTENSQFLTLSLSNDQMLTVCMCASRFPLYYELKIAFVIWLLSPYTRGASLIYRKCLHPLLSSRERVTSSIHIFLRHWFDFVYMPENIIGTMLFTWLNCLQEKCYRVSLSLPLQEIDEYIVQAKERSYETMVNFGRQGLSIAATAAVTAAVKASFSGCFHMNTNTLPRTANCNICHC